MMRSTDNRRLRYSLKFELLTDVCDAQCTFLTEHEVTSEITFSAICTVHSLTLPTPFSWTIVFNQNAVFFIEQQCTKLTFLLPWKITK